MGVRGLKTFIEKNEDLFDRDHHLHDTPIVIDASNLICALFEQSQKHERRDLFGGDMVQFGKCVKKFFDSLKQCEIKPILVFDGAQTYDHNKSKTAEKHKRALNRFLTIMSINKSGFGDFVLPATATNVFRSIAVDKNIKIVQCMFEADLEVARIAQDMSCPVISNDSDFQLINLPHGVITIDKLKHEKVSRFIATHNDSDKTYSYIECSIYYQKNFSRYIPNLEVRNLPLLGVLSGNDFVSADVFEKICARLPNQRTIQQNKGRPFKKPSGKHHEKIVRILYFLCDKTLNEAVNQICLQVSKDKRQKLKKLIISSLVVYKVPEQDDFKSELARLYWPGFQATHRRKIGSDNVLKLMFEENLVRLVNWLKQSMEHSVLSYRCLELANKNIIFIVGNLDDPQLPSAHICQMRPMKVMLSLLRSSLSDSSPRIVYDRIGYSYRRQSIRPMKKLEDFGNLNCTFFDLVEMPPETRRAILLATFHCSSEVFDENVVDYYHWFEARHAEEFLMVKLLLDFIDYECKPVKLWKQFRQATLMCMVYHFSRNSDETFALKLEESGEVEFLENLATLIKKRHLGRMPVMSKKRRYNSRLMHQITQIQSSIVSFNGLNAFLGEIMTRIRTEIWLNSCVIYNLAEALHERSVKLPRMPDIIYNIPRFDKMMNTNDTVDKDDC